MPQELTRDPNQEQGIPGSNSRTALKIHRINGVDMINVSEMDAVICEKIAGLSKETHPNVQAAQDARRIIGELLQGIGGEMEKFKADTKLYLQDIRNIRSAVVVEASQMTGPLKEVRQFFLGGDYKEEMARLREFVELCERLEKLKASGFLDRVADTMLRLA